MRGLTPTFLDHLQSGWLHPLLGRVLADRTLDLQIRDDYLNVYYRGGNLLRLTRVGDTYDAAFDRKYAKGQPFELPAERIDTESTLADWLSAVPALKNCMDLYFGRHPKDEREVQQLIARENNIGGVSRSTDLYVCDIEYANPHGRFDLIAVHWPSTSGDRKRGDGRRLVIGEVKQGDNALAGVAGMHAHVRDVDAFLSDPARRRGLEAEMLTTFNQKRALGLIDVGKDLLSFSDEPPIFLFILANHDPDKTRLREELATLPAAQHCEVRVATSSLMGYGLYDPWIRTVDEVLALPPTML